MKLTRGDCVVLCFASLVVVVIGVSLWILRVNPEARSVSVAEAWMPKDSAIRPESSHKTVSSYQFPPVNVPGQSTIAPVVSRFSPQDEALLAMGREDLQKARRFISEQYPVERQQRALSFLMSELAKEDMAYLKLLLLDATLSGGKALGVALATEYWTHKDLGKLLKFADTELFGTSKNLIYEKAIYALGNQQRFIEAFAALDSMPFSSSRTSAIKSLGLLYAEKRPQDAVQWATSLEVEEDRRDAQMSVLSMLSMRGNVDALGELSHSAVPSLRPSIDAAIGRLLGSQGGTSSEAGNFANAQGMVLVGAIGTIPDSELGKIPDKIVKISDPLTRGQAANAYVGRLFDSSPQRAVAWINSSPPDLRDVAISGLVSKWYRVDSEALSIWINSSQAGHDKDTALVALAAQLRSSDPSTAKTIAGQISDPNRRRAALR